MPQDSIIIAIDGLSASGKGTLAKRLAARLGFAYLDTGLLYRAAGLMAKEAGADLNDLSTVAAFVNHMDLRQLLDRLSDPALRGEKASQAASKVGPCAALRAALLQFQRDFGHSPPACFPDSNVRGAVLDGRDIGTVVLPQAKVKFFVTAEAKVRAHRRFLELQQTGKCVTERQVLDDMRERDKRDQERQLAPTKPADDAMTLDTTEMTADQAFEAALAYVLERVGDQLGLA